jgi:di/tricarboxylate transporter
MRLERLQERFSAWLSSELPRPFHRLPPQSLLILAAAAILGILIALIPAPASAPPKAMLALGLGTFTVILWATQAISQPLASVIFMVLLLALGIGSMRTIAAGFVSNAAWLVLGGLLIATATEKTGFGRWVARKFLGGFQGSYQSLVLGILVGTSSLSFLVPSNMGRVAITVPVVIAIAREAGYKLGSNGYNGLVITAVLGNFTTALAVLPANLLSIMIAGTGEAMYGVHVTYMRWLLLCGPVLGLSKGFLVYYLVPRLYPAPPPQSLAGMAASSGPLSTEAMRVALVLGLAILLWATDFVHGVRPGWIAISAALLLYLPRIGVLPWTELLEKQRFLIVVWISGVLALSAMFSETGASTVLSEVLGKLAGIEGKSPTYGYFAIAYLFSLLTMVATMGGTVPTMMAAVGGISQATGLPIETGMVSLTAGATALLLPYVAAPMVVGLAIGKVDQRVAAKFTLWSALISYVTIIPLNALWWKMIGALP